MDDPSGAWHLDPALRSGMRLERTKVLLEQGALGEAILEAEELLGEEPEHVEGLLLLGEAMLALGDSEGALDALEHHLSLGEASARSLSALTVARFEMCDLAGALETGRECVRIAPDTAEAHYYLGLAHERQGKPTEGARHFIAAFQLDAEHFPFPLELEAADWTRLLSDATTHLPGSLAAFWDGAKVEFHDLPDLAELRAADPPISPTVYGLYRDPDAKAFDPLDDAEEEPRPEALRLFTGNLARCRDEEDLVLQLLETLTHEALGWLGIPPELTGEE